MQVTGRLVPPASHVPLPWHLHLGCTPSGAQLSLYHQTDACGLRVGAEHQGRPRGLRLASGAPAGLRPRQPALRPEEEHCARPPEREGPRLSGHQVPRSPSKASSGHPGLHALTSGGEGLAPTDTGFGPLSKPKFPSPAPVVDANSIPGQLVYPSLQAQQTLHHLRRQERRDVGESQRALDTLQGPKSWPRCDCHLPSQPQAQRQRPFRGKPGGGAASRAITCP